LYVEGLIGCVLFIGELITCVLFVGELIACVLVVVVMGVVVRVWHCGEKLVFVVFCRDLLLFSLDMEARKEEVCAIKVSYQVREG
jgi:hypothetical protein